MDSSLPIFEALASVAASVVVGAAASSRVGRTRVEPKCAQSASVGVSLAATWGSSPGSGGRAGTDRGSIGLCPEKYGVYPSCTAFNERAQHAPWWGGWITQRAL